MEQVISRYVGVRTWLFVTCLRESVKNDGLDMEGPCQRGEIVGVAPQIIPDGRVFQQDVSPLSESQSQQSLGARMHLSRVYMVITL